MKRMFRVIQFASNIAIIILTVVVCIVVVRQYFSESNRLASTDRGPDSSMASSPAPRPSRQDLTGKSLPLPVDWRSNRKSLILYLSTKCRFCDESTPFYQRLTENRPKAPLKIIAVFSQDVDQAKSYLASHRIAVDDVVSSWLGSSGVTSTPTLLLVDENGVVSDFWRGKLNKEVENAVLAKLNS
jgi:thiol-disulfide isomerase/thioredoxin